MWSHDKGVELKDKRTDDVVLCPMCEGSGGGFCQVCGQCEGSGRMLMTTHVTYGPYKPHAGGSTKAVKGIITFEPHVKLES